ncbi:MAG: ATP-binding protein [Desulfobulbaceae bacterium]
MDGQFDENKPLYGSMGIDIYLKLIRQKYPDVDIEEVLEYAEMEPYQITDEGHFFSQRQINRFHDKLVELTGNKKIAREAGRFGSSPGVLGTMRRSLLGLLSPTRYYSLLGKYANKITRSCRYEARTLAPNKVEITVTPFPGTKEEPFQCENRKGYWEAVSDLYKLRATKIEHPECIFEGDAVCRYIVSWPKSPVTFLKMVRNVSLAVIGIACLVLPVLSRFFGFPYLSLHGLALVYTLLLTFLFGVNWLLKKIETKNLVETIEILRASSDDLMDQIEINYKNSLMINEIGQVLAKQSSLKGLFDELIQVLRKRLDFDRVLVMLANPENTRLNYQAGSGYDRDQEAILQNLSFHLDNPDSKGIFYLAFHNKKPILINDIDEIKSDLSPRSYEFAIRMGVKSLICCPIIHEDESLGILAVDNVKSKQPLHQRDLNLLMGIALQLGSRLHNIKLESYLRQAQKMEAVGNLAGGVAHDFNNILTTILGYSQILTMEIPSHDPKWRMIESIHHAGLKASSLTQQLLAFSRKQVMEMQVTNLNIIVEDMNKMLGRLIGEDIVIKSYLASTISNIMADPSQIGQILMNLVVNARDAMATGGQITIETGDIYLDEKFVEEQKGLKAGHYSMLSVTDTGHGMTQELQEKIFEPFFTTKNPGEGTGLGLATVYGIVKQHNGSIYTYSEPGQGTSFKIYFPIVDKKIEGRAARRASITRGGNETILVVDDDDSVRRLVRDTLMPLGYTIITAASGEEALDKCVNANSRVDLVLSDVIMPGINGKQLVDTMRHQCPNVTAMLMSGYTDNVINQHGLDRSHYILINKPLLPISLANKIREVLDTVRSGQQNVHSIPLTNN